jgi:signal transduction histidine kinase
MPGGEAAMADEACEQSRGGAGGYEAEIAELRKQLAIARAEAEAARGLASLAREAGWKRTWVLDLATNRLSVEAKDRETGQTRLVEMSLAEYIGLVHAQDQAKLSACLAEAKKNLLPFELAYRANDDVDRSGRKVWVLIRGQARMGESGHPAQLSGVSFDVNEIKNLEQELHDQGEMMALTLKAAKIAYWSWNPVTNKLIFDEEWFRQIDILGRDATDLDSWWAALHPDDHAMVAQNMQDHISGKTDFYESLMRLKSLSGSYKYVLAKGKILERGDGGRPTRFSGVHVDLTEFMELKEKVESQARQLAEASKLASLGLLASGVAHEVNNALNFISGALAGLNKIVSTSLPPEGRRAASELLAIMASGLNIGVNVARSLDGSVAASRARPGDVSVKDADERALALAQCRIGSTEVKVDVPGDLSVFCAPPSLAQILINLLFNAADAIDPGSRGTISIRARLAGEAAAEFVEIVVGDNGRGMPSEVKGRAFEPFYTTKGVGQGSGLGLYVVKGEAERLGGVVLLESEPGAGATFTVRLPKRRASAAA